MPYLQNIKAYGTLFSKGHLVMKWSIPPTLFPHRLLLRLTVADMYSVNPILHLCSNGESNFRTKSMLDYNAIALSIRWRENVTFLS